MLTPVKQVSFQFTSDGTSTALTIDLSLAPVSLDLRGLAPTAIQDLVVSSSAGAVSDVAATIAGSVATLTFTDPPPELDGNSLLLIYNVSFYVQI